MAKIYCSSKMEILILSAVLLILFLPSNRAESRQRIYIGVLFESSNTNIYDLPQYTEAATLAVETVNQGFRNVRMNDKDIHLIFRPYNSSCKTSLAPVVAAELYHQYNISALVGEFCDEALGLVAHLAAAWNLPIITGSGASCIFSDKTKFKTLTRLSISHCDFVNIFRGIFQQFSWANVTIISDTSNIMYRDAAKDIHAGLMQSGYDSRLLTWNPTSDQNQKKKLEEAGQRSRVIIISSPFEKVGVILKEAWKLGYIQSGQYVFLQFDMKPSSMDKDNLVNLNSSEITIDMYDALLTVKPNFQVNHDIATLNQVLSSRVSKAHEDIHQTKISFKALKIFDSILLYATALNRCLEDIICDYHNGKMLSHQHIWQHELDGISGRFFIDSNGDRQTNFTFNDLNADSLTFKSIASYNYNIRRWDFAMEKIHWPGPANKPPLNEPKCGYKNDNPGCNKSINYIAPIVGYGALIVSVLILLCIITLTIVQICRRFIHTYATPNQIV